MKHIEDHRQQIQLENVGVKIFANDAKAVAAKERDVRASARQRLSKG
jgi:hypothetical protein